MKDFRLIKATSNMIEKEIIEIVARYLEDKHPGGATLEALTQGVRHEEDWWYVPVRPSFEPPRRYEYYELMLRRARRVGLKSCAVGRRRLMSAFADKEQDGDDNLLLLDEGRD